MLQLKKQIIEQYTANLGLFKSIIGEKHYCKSIDLYLLTINNTNNKNKNNCKQTRVNNLNFNPGNYYIFKKIPQSFTKISLESYNSLYDNML